MGVSCSEPQIAVHFKFSKMKAFVAVLSALVAAASGKPQILTYPGYAPYTYANAAQLAYAHTPVTYATHAAPLAAAAPVVTHAAPVVAPVAYATVNPYDYAGQIYPVAEPYIHQEIAAEEYVHSEVEAEPYVHQEIEAEPYIHVAPAPVTVAAAPVAAAAY